MRSVEVAAIPIPGKRAHFSPSVAAKQESPGNSLDFRGLLVKLRTMSFRAVSASFAFLIAAFLTVENAQADGLCSFYRKNAPEIYKALCSKGPVNSKPAGANSSFSDSFNLNSGALPTQPSSYGLEVLTSFLPESTEKKTNFAIVKGFKKFGAGVSTSGNNTFYGNDLAQRMVGTPELLTFHPHEESRGKLTNLNLGTALQLYQAKSGPTVRLGLSARYNKVSDTWGGGPALLLSWTKFTLGAGFTKETVSNVIPEQTFGSYLLSYRLWIFEFEYNLLAAGADYGLNPIHILTTTLSIRRLLLTFAVRRLNYLEWGEVTQRHFAIQYLFSQHFSAGFLMNYIPGSATLGVQIYM
jgi:hypothetical protein